MQASVKWVVLGGVLGLAAVLGGTAFGLARARAGRWEKAAQASLDLFDKGRFSEALGPGEEALKIAEGRFGSSDIRTLYSMELVGKLLSRTGGLARADALLTEASLRGREVFGEASPKRARFVSSLAEVKARQGEFDEAESLHQQVLLLVQGAYGAISGPAALAFARLATLYADWGLYEQAVPVLNRAAAILDRVGQPDRAVSALLDAESCRISVETGRMEEARRTCPASLAARQALVPPDHPDLAASLVAMGLFHLRSGRPDKAQAHVEAAMKVYEKAPAADFRTRDSALMALAELSAGRGDLAAAEEAFNKVRSNSDSPYATVKALIREAGCEMRGGRPKKAAGALNEALSLHAELPLADKLDRELILFGLGESNAAQGRLEEAESFLTRAYEAAEDRHSAGVQDMISALRSLGRVQVAAKRFGRASATARRLTELGDSYGKGNVFHRSAHESAGEIKRAMRQRTGD